MADVRLFLLVGASLASIGCSQSSRAEVIDVSDAGFTISLSVQTGATKDDAWRMLVTPAQWWLPEHTYSGDAANLSIDAQASGCFCEQLSGPADARPGQRMGSVEHMRVIYTDPRAGILRLSGGLGPLQPEAVNGTMTFRLVPEAAGVRITLEYAVGGYMRMKPHEIAQMVDRVLGAQLGSLADRLGKRGGQPRKSGD